MAEEGHRRELPEVTEVQRFRYQPGDRFIVKVPGNVGPQEAAEIERRFRAAAQLPDGTPVVILPGDWDVTIAAPLHAVRWPLGGNWPPGCGKHQLAAPDCRDCNALLARDARPLD